TPKSVMIGLHAQNVTADAEDIKQIKIVKHPKWDDDTMDYDFALIKLEKNSTYPAIKLNTVPVKDKVNFITAGWGTLSEGGSVSNALMKVEVPFVSQEQCSKDYPGWVTDSMLCAGFEEGGKDACQGDSGGPLIIRNEESTVLAGVVSWGAGCARPNQPGVYSKVSGVLDWVQETIAE
ncbi:MAG: serine protease, partial [Elusimicrobiota bacterium]|nr:serine protease [Elusimicrobiota bacterium]